MSTRSAVERPSRIVFVASRDRVPPPSDGALVTVMDTAWTLGPGERRDLLSLRPMVARVVERVDLYEDALERLDLWASAASVIERTTLDGISLWHGIREQAWRWLHERLLWASVVESISRDHEVVDFRCDPTEVALRQVLEAGGYGMAHGSTTPDQPGATAPGATVPVAARIDQRVFAALAVVARRARRRAGALGPSSGSAMAPDTAELDGRVRTAAALGDRGVLVLSYVRLAQTVGGGEAGRIADPHLDAIVDRLGAVGMVPIVLALGLDRRDRPHGPLSPMTNGSCPAGCSPGAGDLAGRTSVRNRRRCRPSRTGWRRPRAPRCGSGARTLAQRSWPRSSGWRRRPLPPTNASDRASRRSWPSFGRPRSS